MEKKRSVGVVAILLLAAICYLTFSFAEANEFQGEFYVNKEFGFEIIIPKGWFQDRYAFKRSNSTNKNYPSITFSADVLEFHTLIDFAKFINNEIIGSFVTKPPEELTINGIKAVKLIAEYPAEAESPPTKVIHYMFQREGKEVFNVISFIYTHKADEFEKYLKDFEQMVNSFKFI